MLTIQRLLVGAALAIGLCCAGSATAASASAPAAAVSAPTHQIPRLHNGIWCENPFKIHGISGEVCLTFSGGEVRGYVEIASAPANCTMNVAVIGPDPQYADGIPCNNGAGTYFASVTEGTYTTYVDFFIDGNYVGSASGNDHYGP